MISSFRKGLMLFSENNETDTIRLLICDITDRDGVLQTYNEHPHNPTRSFLE
jgi:hypothetical protein